MSEHTPTHTGARASTNVVPLEAERRTYMISPRLGQVARRQGIQPLSAAGMNQIMSTLGLEEVRRIRIGSGSMQALNASAGEANDIIVTRMEPARAEALRRNIPGNLIITENTPLDYGVTTPKRVRPFAGAVAATAQTITRTIRFQVVGQQGEPLSKVMVELTGDAFPVRGVTAENGEVELELVTLGDRPPRLLTARPPHTYWDLYLPEPQVTPGSVNLIQMRPLSETIPGFPQQFHFGWGQRLMDLNHLPRGMNGAGVKIAIIDSGCDNSHPLLRHVRFGRDYTDDPDPTSWNQDLIGHGTHCAGIIAANSVDGSMMRGFAPEAEIHILRVFPGGGYIQLTEALLYCIEHRIDLVNMSLGGGSEIDEGVEQWLEAATLHGITCIVAAGNSGDAVKYPARSPQTLAVAAVGILNELQPYTWEQTTVQQGRVTADGIFSPSFTCFGPEIGVCAPGVSIISTVPGGFKAESGTSMAAPHITGLTALLLAHHPLFKGQFRERSPQRVGALFQMIRELCWPYPFDRSLAGAGMPRLGPFIEALQGRQAAPVVAPQPIYAVPMMPGITSFAAGPQLVPYQVGTPYYTVRY